MYTNKLYGLIYYDMKVIGSLGKYNRKLIKSTFMVQYYYLRGILYIHTCFTQ